MHNPVRPSCAVDIARLLLLIMFASLLPYGKSSVTYAAAAELSCFPSNGTASISGRVTSTAAFPIQGVSVTAYTLEGRRATSASTNAMGNYQLQNLVGGSYVIEFRSQMSIHVGEWYNNQSKPQAATPVTITTGANTTGIDAVLADGARISGTVTGAGSGPLSNMQVVVYDMQQRQVASAYTDAAGKYSVLPGLPSGSYKLFFSASAGYLSSYYNNKSSFESADTLHLVAPNILSNINATLAKGGSISGKVVDSTNTPLGNIGVYADGPDASGYAYTDSNGLYTIAGLVSGSYNVMVKPIFDDVNLISSPITATVTVPNLTNNINFTMTPGGILTGRVTGPGGTPLENISVYIGQDDGDFGDYFYTDAAGIYKAVGLPSGKYSVTFRTQSYIEERYNNKLLESDQPADLVQVTAPNTVSGIDAELALGGIIKGKLTDADDGTPIKDVFVEVLDSNGQRVANTRSDASGLYKTPPTLPPGSYSIRFNTEEANSSCAYVTEYHNNKLNKETADKISIVGADTILIDAALSKGSYMSGKITDADTGAPITSGGVRIYDSSGKQLGFGRFSAIGIWRTTSALPSGNYLIQFYDDDSGYIDEYYNDKLTKAEATPIRLTAPTNRTDIDAALSKGASISGRVTAADTGLVFIDGDIYVYDLSGAEVASTWIRDDGSYIVDDGLAPGSYLIACVPFSSTGSEISSILPAQAMRSAPSKYASTFYGNTISMAKATTIRVTNANSISGIDITMLQGIWLPRVGR